ncbi:MAG: von Willebrand factor type A domain-containing protein, partial [Arenimonas sp.]
MNRKPLVFAISLILFTACSPQVKKEVAAEAAATATSDKAKATREVDQLRVTGSRKRNIAEEEKAQPSQVVTMLDAPAEPGLVTINSPPPSPPSPQAMPARVMAGNVSGMLMQAPPEQNTEKYKNFNDNPIFLTAENPVSTFSIDVDTGSYSNVRRMLNSGTRPPADSVRAEEIINYFDFAYAPPNTRRQPFSVNTEIAAAPWNAKHQLVLVGIKGYEVPRSQIPAANVVFLIDTSGSMSSEDKLPLLIASFKEMTMKMRPQDRVSIVVYAGSAGLVLPATSGDDKETILRALDKLQAGGSTNGGQGIELAYKIAKENYISNGVNRVILATDGDFNVGIYDTEMLKTLVADQRKSGIALTTLGFGQGNYNDQMAEQLAD